MIFEGVKLYQHSECGRPPADILNAKAKLGEARRAARLLRVIDFFINSIILARIAAP